MILCLLCLIYTVSVVDFCVTYYETTARQLLLTPFSQLTPYEAIHMYSVSLLSQGVEELVGKEEQVSYILYCFVKTDSSVQLRKRRKRVWESGMLDKQCV